MQTYVASAPHVRRIGLATTIVSGIAILWLTLLPDNNPPLPSHWCLVCGSQGGVDAVLNVLLFVPLGIGLALAGVRARDTALAVFALSGLIELAQLLVITGRDATIGDVVTNTFGGALGFTIGRFLFWLLSPDPGTAIKLALGWAVFWLVVQTISAVGFRVAPPSGDYYGQIARRLGHFEQFEGRVLATSIGRLGISDSRLANSKSVALALKGGAIVSVTVVPQRGRSGVAPILRIVDTSGKEVLLVAQRDEDAVFAISTIAAKLRLRPPVFALRDALRTPSGYTPIDTTAVTARFLDSAVVLQSSTRSALHVRLGASLGWVLFLPVQALLDGSFTQSLISAGWVAFLFVPIGYWLSIAGVGQKGENRANPVVFGLFVLVLIFTGQVIVPFVVGVGMGSAGDWGASIAGLVTGAMLEIAFRRRRFQANGS